MAISARLCDVPLDSTTLGADILALITFEFSDAELHALAAYVEASEDTSLNFESRGLDQLVSRLVGIWYSGIAPMRNGSERVLSYTDATGWAATGYAKPPSYCGAAFGEWAQAPSVSSSGK